MTGDQIGIHLDSIVSGSRDGFWVIDPGGRTLYVNARAAELLGRSREEMFELNVVDVLDEVGREQFRTHLVELRDRGVNPVDVECRYRRPDGESVRLMVGESELRDEQGKLIGYVHRMIADSHRLLVLEELQRSQSLLADSQAIASLGSWEYDTGGDTSMWSAQLYDVLGLDPEVTEPSVATFFDLVLPEDRDELWALFLACQEDRIERQHDARIRRPDGTVRWVRATGRALDPGHGRNAARIGGTVQDIDSEKQTELQLRDSVVLNTLMQFMATAANQARTLREALVTLRDLLLAHPDWLDAVAFEVRDGRLGRVDLATGSEGAVAQLRVAREAFETDDVVFDEHTRPHHPSISFPVMLHGQSVIVAVITARSPFERQSMLRSMAEQVAAQLGTVALREAVNDELSAARDAAMEASRAKSEFVATMSHEIRTPLNGVIGLNDLLLRTELDDRQRQLAEAMRGAGHALMGLINEILDFSKIEAGALELEHVAFSPARVTREVVELFRPAADVRDNHLRAEIPEAVPPVVVGDPGRFRQVLSNLVSNAVKFTSGGEVVITVEATSDSGATTLRVSVSDTGPGMDAVQMGRAFEPFRQADAATMRDFGGTGLGLTIARQLAVALGGELGATSVPGEGSTFWFSGTFPLGDVESIPAPAPRPAAGPVRHWGHVLVVEDNETNQLVALGMLEAMGLTAEVATDGRQGAEKALSGGFDLVLMDLQMPVADGFEGARLIRAGEPAGSHLPLLALTASTTDDVRARCDAVGMDGFLTKPLSYDRLEAEVVRWVDGAAPAPRTTTGFDPGRLDELAEMGAAAEPLIRRAVDNFVDGIDERLAGMRLLAAQGDAGALRTAAHGLKGSAANLGAVEVVDLALELELFAEEGLADRDHAATLITLLDTAAGRAIGELKRHPVMVQTRS